MRISILLSSSFLTISAALPAAAVPCGLSTLGTVSVITCNQPGSDPVASNEDDLIVRVTGGADVTSANRANPAIAVGGTNVVINNSGRIEMTDRLSNSDAIRITGEDTRVINSGAIVSGDRAIHATGGTGTILVENTGTIFSRRQAIRTENNLALPGLTVNNFGTVESTEGRAIQGRGPGTNVTNYGSLYGWEEVIEARDGFSLLNFGLIEVGRRVRDSEGNVIGIERKDDQDGVQFASGWVSNLGTIIGTDDGIDIDEGFISNATSGRIISLGPDDSVEKSAIDIDGAFVNGRDPLRPAGTVTISNRGYIEGPRAITTAYDPNLPGDDVQQSRSSVDITNRGTLLGRGGTAIGLAPTQADSSLWILGENRIFGDVIFGGGDDRLLIGNLTSGMIGDGLFDGGMGFNTVNLFAYLLSDVVSFKALGNVIFALALQTDGGVASARFTNWDFWTFNDDTRLATSELSARFAPAAIPLPAGLVLMLTALGGLGLMRRRRVA